MPLYEYYCSECKSKFELLVSHKYEDEVVCVKCHGEKVRRLLSIFATAHSEGDYSDSSFEEMAGGSCSCGGNCSCD